MQKYDTYGEVYRDGFLIILLFHGRTIFKIQLCKNKATCPRFKVPQGFVAKDKSLTMTVSAMKMIKAKEI